jgi:hypothetical protein
MQQPRITAVSLYNQGIAYINRRTNVTENNTISMEFNEDQMDDILKSFHVADLSGGTIESVSYDSTMGIRDQLRDVHISLDGKNTADFYNQFRGYRIKVTTSGDTTYNGTFIRLDTVNLGEDHGEEYIFTMYQDNEGLSRMKLNDVFRMKFMDDDVNRDFEKLMSVTNDSKKKHTKKVHIKTQKGDSTDETRTVDISYVTKVPVFKFSYRFVIKDKKLAMQAWVIVDNTTRDTWSDIQLSIISGVPRAFRTHLFPAKFKTRPLVQVDDNPVVDTAEPQVMMDVAAERSIPMLLAGSTPHRRMKRSTVKPRVQAERVGELFQYDIETPVTIEAHSSAMIPIYNGPIKGRVIAVYDHHVHGKYPMSSLEITNNTGKSFESGPATVYHSGDERDTFSGDTMLPFLRMGQQKWLRFGVHMDLPMKRESLPYDTKKTHQISILNGTITLKRWVTKSVRYYVKNQSDRVVLLVIRHNKTPGWELVAPTLGYEVVDDYYHFMISVFPQAIDRYTKQKMYNRYKDMVKVTVNKEDDTYIEIRESKEEVFTRLLDIGNISDVFNNRIIQWSNNGVINKQLSENLERLRLIQSQYNQYNERTNSLKIKLNSMGRSRDELRKDMSVSRDDGTQRDLSMIRSKINETNEKISNLETELEKLKEQYESIISTIVVESMNINPVAQTNEPITDDE